MRDGTPHVCQPPYAGEIRKDRFIHNVRPTIPTNPEKLSTENEAFRKCSSIQTRVILERPALSKLNFFKNNDFTTIKWYCPPRVVLAHKSKMAAGNNKQVAKWVQLDSYFAPKVYSSV